MLIVSERLQLSPHEISLSFSRSSGKGGQNVNKVSTKALLKWDLENSTSVSGELKKRFRNKFANRINTAGEVVISSEQFRSQSQNEEDCLKKLAAMIKAVEFPPKKRKKTKPSLSQKKKRLESKRKRSEKKENRRKIY